MIDIYTLSLISLPYILSAIIVSLITYYSTKFSPEVSAVVNWFPVIFFVTLLVLYYGRNVTDYEIRSYMRNTLPAAILWLVFIIIYLVIYKYITHKFWYAFSVSFAIWVVMSLITFYILLEYIRKI